MEDIWEHSRLIDPAESSKTPAFTTLPIRIHKRNDIADAASRRLLKDWGRHLQDGQAEKSLTSISRLGNLCAFAYPEVLPERLAVLTYLTDMGLMHDDASEAMDIDKAMAEHKDFEASFDMKENRKPAAGSRAAKLKKLASQLLLEAIDLDRELGMYMLEMYQKEWVAVVEKRDVSEFNSLDEYYAYRIDNFGMRAFWPMVEFGMAFRLSDDEKNLVKGIFEPIEEVLMWTNDYWSFDRECEESQVYGHRLVNVVDVVRRTESLSTEDAKQRVRQMMVRCEQDYVKRKAAFYAGHQDVSLNMRRWIEVAGCIVSGSHYWASSCDRHHAWRDHSVHTIVRTHDALDCAADTQATKTGSSMSSLSARSATDANEGSTSSGVSDTSVSDYGSASSDVPDTRPSAENPTGNSGAGRQIGTTLEKRKRKVSFDSPEDSLKEDTSGVRNALNQLLDAVEQGEKQVRGLGLQNAKLLRSLEESRSQLALLHRSKRPSVAGFREASEWYKPPEVAIAEPARYISSMPSKGVRSTLIEALNYWLNVPQKSLEVIKGIVDLLHNASLILDDIEDNSPLRRGKAATHAIFGHAQAINSANFMFVQAVQEARKLSDPGAVDILLDDLENLYLGQSWDLYWKYNLECPSVDEYLNMVDNKTGGMFRMLLRLMQAESARISIFDFDRLTFLFGRFFQIRDDYMNLRSGVYSDQKGFCEDLDEGKFSYPIVHCLEHHPQFKDHIIGIFRQRPVTLTSGSQPLSKETKMHVVNYLRAAGTFKACQTYLTEMEAEIESELGKLEGVTGETNPMLRLILTRLSVRDIVERQDGEKLG